MNNFFKEKRGIKKLPLCIILIEQRALARRNYILGNSPFPECGGSLETTGRSTAINLRIEAKKCNGFLKIFF